MSEKFENVLNLALETPREERLQTEDLDVGFDDRTGRWELIVKYNGSLKALLEAGIGVEYLIAGYALLDVPEELVSLVDSFPGIEYVEKPKQYFYADPGPADRNACITGITAREPFLRGKDVLIAVLDSGIDYRNPVFLDSEGRTRILALWDQSIQTEDAPPPEGFQTGAEYTSERIDAALQAASEAEGYAIQPGCLRPWNRSGRDCSRICSWCLPGGGNRGKAFDCEAWDDGTGRISRNHANHEGGHIRPGNSVEVSDASGHQSKLWKHLWSSQWNFLNGALSG